MVNVGEYTRTWILWNITNIIYKKIWPGIKAWLFGSGAVIYLDT